MAPKLVLSVRFGGSATHTELDRKRLRTYCLYYQKPPHRYGMLCQGYLFYDPCPDFAACVAHRPSPRAIKDLEDELKEGAEGAPEDRG